MSEPTTPPRIPLGPALPELGAVPTLAPAQALAGADAVRHGRHSHLGEGWAFEGKAQLAGSMTIAGDYRGELDASAPTGEGHVTIAESGRLRGDLRARSLSVLGEGEGLLQADGRVTLHGSAVVSGRLRYGQLQVNGAELNAQVERLGTP